MKEYIMQRIATLKSENRVVRFPIEQTIFDRPSRPVVQIKTDYEEKLEKGRESYFDYWRQDEQI